MALMPEIVVIGAGFGGIEVARRLRDQPVDVTLVDQHNFHTFQPLLYQVATSGLNAADVAHAVRGLFQRQSNLQFRQATVTGVDWAARRVHVDGQPDLPFDHLVVAAGATVSYFGTPGAAEHALGLYTLEDAVALRNHIVERFEIADTDSAAIDGGVPHLCGGGRGSDGGGDGGCARGAHLHRVPQGLPGARTCPGLASCSSRCRITSSRRSQRRAARTHCSRSSSAASRCVSGRRSPRCPRTGSSSPTVRCWRASTLIWAAGVQANALALLSAWSSIAAAASGWSQDLQITGHVGGWAVGDIAGARSASGDLLPQLAPVAIQAGRHVASQIDRHGEVCPLQPFRYRNQGTMATIGRRAAVAELPGASVLRGGVAWLAWLGLHLVYLVGKRNRASVLLNWAWNYLTWDRGPRLILRPSR